MSEKAIIKMISNRESKCAFCHQDICTNDEFLWLPVEKKPFHTFCPIIPISMNVKTSRRNIDTIDVKTLNVQAHVMPKLTDLFDGRFTVPFCINNEEMFCTVKLKTLKKGKFIGSRQIKVHFGRHDGQEFIKAAYITISGELKYYADFYASQIQHKNAIQKAISLVVKGEKNEELAMLYAKISQRCWRCGKELYNPITLEKLEERYGAGPHCWKWIEEHPFILEKIKQAKEPEIITLT